MFSVERIGRPAELLTEYAEIGPGPQTRRLLLSHPDYRL